MFSKTLLRSAILFVIVLLQLPSHGQSLSRIEKFIEKAEYDKFKDILDKSEEKDSTRIGVKYYYSIYFSTPSKPFFNVDSADFYIRQATKLYRSATEDIISELKSDGINEQSILTQKEVVHELAFNQATDVLTLSSINVFITRFEGAPQYTKAIVLRDSLAFSLTNSNPSAQAYLQYANTYPSSIYQEKARQLYDSLNYVEKTNPEDIASLEEFLLDYPETPFKSDATALIFKLSTKAHELKSYLTFIKKYPLTKHARIAVNLAYHLDKLVTIDALTGFNITDSLKAAYRQEQDTWFPFSKDNKIGFFGKKGVIEMNSAYAEVSESLKCTGLDEPVFVAKSISGKSAVFNRAGIKLISDVVPSTFQVLDQQVFVLTQNGKKLAFHVSGALITEGFDELALINGKWLMSTKGSKKTILNFQGESFITGFEDIEQEGEYYIFETPSGYTVLNDISMLQKMDVSKTEKLIMFDDYEFSNDHLIVFQGDQEALIDPMLNIKVTWGNHEIYYDYNQWIVKTANTVRVLDKAINDGNDTYLKILSNSGWIALQKKDKWSLKSRKNINVDIDKLDSVKLKDEYCTQIFRADSSFLLFQNGKTYLLNQGTNAVKLQGAQGLRHHFILVERGMEKLIFDSHGNEHSLGKLNDLFVIGDSLFRFSQKGKVGLVNLQGEIVLKPLYDIAEKDKTLIYLLDKSMIGAYDIEKKITIDPKYNQKVEKLGRGYLAKKGEEYLWLDQKSVNLLSKPYKEIAAWNDTSVWVRNDLYWTLLTSKSVIIIDQITSIKPLIDEDLNHIFSIQKGSKYALYSVELGMLTDFIFDDISMLGGKIVFAEQELDFAGFFVITYFDHEGQKITSHAYRKEIYDQIWCDQ